jgi:hypothetical protein
MTCAAHSNVIYLQELTQSCRRRRRESQACHYWLGGHIFPGPQATLTVARLFEFLAEKYGKNSTGMAPGASIVWLLRTFS